MQRISGGKEIAVRIDERWDRFTTGHGSPAVVFPFRVQREMNADRDFRMLLENRDRFLIPRAGKHHRDRERQSGGDEPLHAHVDAVAHPDVVGADDQRDVASLRRQVRRRASEDDTSVNAERA